MNGNKEPNNIFIDLCNDSDSTDNESRTECPVVGIKGSINNKVITPPPRRERRIDLCMEKASNDIINNRSCESDDSSDEELKQLVRCCI